MSNLDFGAMISEDETLESCLMIIVWTRYLLKVTTLVVLSYGFSESMLVPNEIFTVPEDCRFKF